jgi:hypothetical protein
MKVPVIAQSQGDINLMCLSVHDNGVVRSIVEDKLTCLNVLALCTIELF